MAWARSRTQQREQMGEPVRLALLEQDADDMDMRMKAIETKLNRILFGVLAVALTLAGNLALLMANRIVSGAPTP